MISVVNGGHFNEIRGTASILFLLFVLRGRPSHSSSCSHPLRCLNASRPFMVFPFAPFPQLVSAGVFPQLQESERAPKVFRAPL